MLSFSEPQFSVCKMGITTVHLPLGVAVRIGQTLTQDTCHVNAVIILPQRPLQEGPSFTPEHLLSKSSWDKSLITANSGTWGYPLTGNKALSEKNSLSQRGAGGNRWPRGHQSGGHWWPVAGPHGKVSLATLIPIARSSCRLCRRGPPCCHRRVWGDMGAANGSLSMSPFSHDFLRAPHGSGICWGPIGAT